MPYDALHLLQFQFHSEYGDQMYEKQKSIIFIGFFSESEQIDMFT